TDDVETESQPIYTRSVDAEVSASIAASPLARPVCCTGAATIADSHVGQIGGVCYSDLDEQDAAMLRAMGLRPRARVRVCRVGETCIVEVIDGPGCSCRIQLSRQLARRVMLA